MPKLNRWQTKVVNRGQWYFSKQILFIYLFVFSFLSLSTAVHAHGLIFVDIIGLDRVPKQTDEKIKHNELLSRATLFYSRSFGNIQVLGEFIANSKESHFGRVKVGWKIDPSNLIWLGRTHNPASYWRDQFHHGGWLQPSISRPSIAEFEVPGGILPSHSTGLLYDGGSLVNNHDGFAYTFSLGDTSKLNTDGLQVPKLIDNSNGVHSSSLAYRLSYRFEAVPGGNEIGILGSNNHIVSELSQSSEVEQRIFGVFANWYYSDLRIVSEITSVTNDVLNTGKTTSNEAFINAYIMADYNLSNDWNIFSRWEDTLGEEDSVYLSYFPKFVIKRNMAGARYSITRSQILKFEISDNQIFSGTQYRQLAVEWSYVYP